MASDEFRWRHSPDAPFTVSAAAFARLVAENDLKPIKAGGYLWAWLPTEDGYDTYRTNEDPFDTIAIETATTSDPSAGSEISYTLPSGYRYVLYGFEATLVTSADAANRQPRMEILRDGTNITLKAVTSVNQTASQTTRWAWVPGDTIGVTVPSGLGPNMCIAIGVSPIELEAGGIVRTVTANVQAADNWGAGTLFVKRVAMA